MFTKSTTTSRADTDTALVLLEIITIKFNNTCNSNKIKFVNHTTELTLNNKTHRHTKTSTMNRTGAHLRLNKLLIRVRY